MLIFFDLIYLIILNHSNGLRFRLFCKRDDQSRGELKINNIMIYDLDKEYFLSQDIEYIIQRINEFYDFEKRDSGLIFTSKIELQNETHFTSDDAHNSFFKLVPRIKSLHNDMYRILESVYNAKNEKKFEWGKLQNKYPLIKEFTYLNNRFKHYKKEHNLLVRVCNANHKV